QANAEVSVLADVLDGVLDRPPDGQPDTPLTAIGECHVDGDRAEKKVGERSAREGCPGVNVADLAGGDLPNASDLGEFGHVELREDHGRYSARNRTSSAAMSMPQVGASAFQPGTAFTSITNNSPRGPGSRSTPAT